MRWQLENAQQADRVRKINCLGKQKCPRTSTARSFEIPIKRRLRKNNLICNGLYNQYTVTKVPHACKNQAICVSLLHFAKPRFSAGEPRHATL